MPQFPDGYRVASPDDAIGHYWGLDPQQLDQGPWPVTVNNTGVWSAGAMGPAPYDTWLVGDRLPTPGSTPGKIENLVTVTITKTCDYCNGRGGGIMGGRCPVCSGRKVIPT